MTSHYRQASFASSFVSTSASQTGLGIRTIKPKTAKIGPWKFGKPLGKGATGRVFLATNIETGRKAAVKIVSKAALREEQRQNDEDNGCDSAGLSYGIEREIIIMKLLNHKNVLRLYDVWETEKQLYLILEYVEGGELFDLLVESGPLPEKAAVDFFKQIILGASYCHSLGICHRDLKPENILLDKDLNVKIADFGMAALESGRLLETSCGSPHYAAPEIVSGLSYHGAESDVWSCGVILFAILTGRLPFDDDNIRDLLLKVQVGKYEIVENLSLEAKDLLNKMLTVDPQQRIKTKDILKHPLIKKYYNCDEDIEYINLPAVDYGTSPVSSKDKIDERILENLVILWHGRSEADIIDALLSTEANPEKTFYSLLLQYRHEHADKNELVRSTSIISKVTESTSSSSLSKKRFSYTASSSARRPVSFQSFRNSKSKDSLHGKDIQIPDHASPPPTSGPAYEQYIMQMSRTNSSQHNSSPEIMPHSSSSSKSKSQRNSMLFAGSSTPTKRQSIIQQSMEFAPSLPHSNIGTSNNNIMPKSLKRNSITSKVLSSYAKMAEFEEKKKPDEFGKRSSADFAALCDALFGDGQKGAIPNSESMATINAIVFGNGNGNKRSSKRLSIYSKGVPRKSFNSKINKPGKSIQSAVPTLPDGIPSSPSSPVKDRTTSDPISRISKLLNSKDINAFERRIASEAPATNLSNETPPPKPMSRLDPRYRAYEAYQNRKSQDALALLKAAEEAEAEAIAKAQEEAKLAQEQEKMEQEVIERAKEQEELAKAREVPTKLSEVFVPPVTRMSKLGNSNRYSVLSMYSTKQSSKRLSFYLKELDAEIARTTSQAKRDRLSRLSMVVTDEFAGEPELNIDDGDNETINHNSWGTVIDEETADTSVDLIGQPKSAVVSDNHDEDLFFVDKNDTSTGTFHPPQPILNNKESTDSFATNNSDDAKHVNKLPKIPGSPVKQRERSGTTGTFEIFEDAIRKSKQEFESPKKEGTEIDEKNTNPPKLNVGKQRKPLNEVSENLESRDKRKSSFFRKLSQPQDFSVSQAEKRKSSFGEALKSFFAGSGQASEVSLNTMLNKEDAFEALKTLLAGWKHYGIDNLNIDPRKMQIDGAVLKNNSLHIKSTKFSCLVMESSKASSKLVFRHNKGSAKSFSRLVEEVKRILVTEDILVC